MRRKVIRAELRKESESFPNYFKYEIDIQEEDGSISRKIPAYGKDLQDALSRVVHDKKIEVISKKIEVVPWWGWVLIWFAYLSTILIWTKQTSNMIVLGAGLFMVFFGISLLMSWSRERNKDRKA
jgi:hypothetical protein